MHQSKVDINNKTIAEVYIFFTCYYYDFFLDQFIGITK